MRGGSWLLALVGASATEELVLEMDMPAVFGLRFEDKGVVKSAESHRRSNGVNLLSLGFGNDV